MSQTEHSARRFYAVSYDDDTPSMAPGSLIPAGRFSYFPRAQVLELAPRPARLALPPRLAVALLTLLLLIGASIGSSVYLNQSGRSLLASATPQQPIVIEHPYTKERMPLNYGTQVAFTESNFFTDTRDAFIISERTFVEADLAALKLRYFERGVLVKQYNILSKGASGSLWETPAGLYSVEHKKKEVYSSFGQMYQPWSISFQGNFYIHGTPYYPDGAVVATDVPNGGIRLADADAEELFGLVTVGTPVLVYERPAESDIFLYEPKIPELDTPHYLIADVKSSTVLASSDLDAAAPIASLTKLMTAVVAAEYINLDSTIYVNQPTFVQSLIPRLRDRTQVSMYSLLELLLIESSNEAADVIAAEVGHEQFVNHMNERAEALGMTHTTFADPSGLSSNNVSSVGDLLRLTQYIEQKRRFIFDITEGKPLPDIYTSGEFGNLSNFNDVAELENFKGGKIGETSAAGQTSITLHTLKVRGEERTLAIILLGSDSRNADVAELLRYAEERFGS